MMIMFPTFKRGYIHYLAGKFEGRVGLLLVPWEGMPFVKPDYYFPYGVDNGAWAGFDADRFIKLLLHLRTFHKPLWVVVPDVVGDAEATMKMWHEWKDRVASFGYALAFAAQDGMEPQDIPADAYCCFVGGTTKWKLENAYKFKGIREWLHIGRVSTGARLRWAEELGADSCDGTGWFREGMDGNRVNALIEYFEGSPQGKLF